MDLSKQEKRRHNKFKYRKTGKAYGLIGFPMLWWVLFFVIAFLVAVFFSFSNITLAKLANGRPFKMVFDNYSNIFAFSSTKFNKEFWQSLKVTMIWTFAMMLGNNVMALLCSFLVHSLKKGKRFFLALLFWPSLVSGVVGSDVTKTIFGSDSGSLANKIVMLFGGEPINWLTDPNIALFSLMITPFFFGFCTKMLIYYASIVSIPKTYTESASIETNSKFTVFRTITLPLLKNTIILNCILSIIDGFKVLGPMQLVTQGGYGTESTMLYVYNTAFVEGKIGLASALSIVLFLIILIFTILQRKLSGKEVDYIE